MEKRTSLQTDLLAMNVSWLDEDLELWYSFDLAISLLFTVLRVITLILAIIVHRAFYKLMKRLPGRAINQIIFPYMVSYLLTFLSLVSLQNLIFFQVMLSTFVGPYTIFLSLLYWVYPLKDYIGDTGCYMLIYFRDIGIQAIQLNSFFLAIFRYVCLFQGKFLLKFNISPNVST